MTTEAVVVDRHEATGCSGDLWAEWRNARGDKVVADRWAVCERCDYEAVVASGVRLWHEHGEA